MKLCLHIGYRGFAALVAAFLLMAVVKNSVRFLVIPAKAGIQNLDPESKPAPDHDPGSGVTDVIPVNWGIILPICIRESV